MKQSPVAPLLEKGASLVHVGDVCDSRTQMVLLIDTGNLHEVIINIHQYYNVPVIVTAAILCFSFTLLSWVYDPRGQA